MLQIKQIKELFHSLNEKLKKKGVTGELGICGGAVMCLVFKARAATKDVDAIFEPVKEIRKAAKEIALEQNLSEDWLNDGVKGFFYVDPPRESVMELSNLRIWAPTAEYMLAMKCVSARFDSHDIDDVEFLVKYLDLKSKDKVFSVISKYYPHNAIPPKTQFMIEELVEKLHQE